ncbi:MAG: DNA primase [Ignavibacteria bacterium GWA2_35_9]|nr:MAG: DNA primase [Ignavibacteria bacterium GWA2_35_9]OGU44686.1 MAG: DNA primase [Ignavibacteria bacterium GWB2_36_8]OGU51737.1 MAG: DNA primase [Ignavibacteria bacterium GWC2_36_12]OGV03940.1 MAG: DNA primase [Ignavibacteria bacterium RIFOXYB2_FULL_36_7]
MRIPESKIEEIRSTASIVDVISGYVQLRKRGRNYLGLCPFHSEKTPSFTVSEDKQIYHCFGCHAGGNVFKFLMDYEKISFIESVQELAAQLGIDIEYESSPGDEKQSEQEVFYDINTEAAKYFYNNLHNSDEGEIVRKYLQERKIKTQTIKTFGLGYALRGWENFLNFAKENKLDIGKIVELGILIKNDDGRHHDRFAGRLIFPIFSPNGRVVAFAGRVLDEREKGAKYLNSPESLIYIKGRILYGLSFAKDEIRKLDKAILVEGYMDLISLFQAGIKNVVAVSGTALTEEQVQLLSRYTKNVVLLFDADTAGIKASMRSIELLLKKDVEVKIAALPGGEDPDSFINNYGKEKFEEIISYAQNFLEYQSGYFEKQGMFNDPAKMTEAIRELVKSAALINDELKRNLLIKTIAKNFSLREILIENELEKILKKEKATAKVSKPIAGENAFKEILNVSSDLNITDSEFSTEKEIVKLLFEGNKEVIELIVNHVDPYSFSISYNRELFKLAVDTFDVGESIVAGALLDKLEEENSKAYLREITFEKYGISKIWDDIYPGADEKLVLMKYAKDTLKKFKLQQIDREINENHKRLEETTDENEKLEIMRKKVELEKNKIAVIKELSSEEVV